MDLLLLLPPQVPRPALGVGRVHLQGRARATLDIIRQSLAAYKNVNLKGLNDVLGDVQDEDGDHQDDRQDANAASGHRNFSFAILLHTGAT